MIAEPHAAQQNGRCYTLLGTLTKAPPRSLTGLKSLLSALCYEDTWKKQVIGSNASARIPYYKMKYKPIKQSEQAAQISVKPDLSFLT